MPATATCMVVGELEDLDIVVHHDRLRQKTRIEFVSSLHNVQLDLPARIASTLGDRVIASVDAAEKADGR